MMKQTITKWELTIRAISILIVILLATSSDREESHLLNLVFFVGSFALTLYFRRHFFPFISAAIFCYIAATTQELWNPEYVKLTYTQMLWTGGNLLLCLGIVDFAYRIYFKFKIIEDDTDIKE